MYQYDLIIQTATPTEAGTYSCGLLIGDVQASAELVILGRILKWVSRKEVEHVMRDGCCVAFLCIVRLHYSSALARMQTYCSILTTNKL